MLFLALVLLLRTDRDEGHAQRPGHVLCVALSMHRVNPIHGHILFLALVLLLRTDRDEAHAEMPGRILCVALSILAHRSRSRACREAACPWYAYMDILSSPRSIIAHQSKRTCRNAWPYSMCSPFYYCARIETKGVQSSCIPVSKDTAGASR